MPELTFAGRVSEELRQTVVLRDEVLGRIDKIKTDKLPGPGGIHLRVLKGVKYEIVDLLTKIS